MSRASRHADELANRKDIADDQNKIARQKMLVDSALAVADIGIKGVGAYNDYRNSKTAEIKATQEGELNKSAIGWNKSKMEGSDIANKASEVAAKEKEELNRRMYIPGDAVTNMPQAKELEKIFGPSFVAENVFPRMQALIKSDADNKTYITTGDYNGLRKELLTDPKFMAGATRQKLKYNLNSLVKSNAMKEAANRVVASGGGSNRLPNDKQGPQTPTKQQMAEIDNNIATSKKSLGEVFKRLDSLDDEQFNLTAPGIISDLNMMKIPVETTLKQLASQEAISPVTMGKLLVQDKDFKRKLELSTLEATAKKTKLDQEIAFRLYNAKHPELQTKFQDSEQGVKAENASKERIAQINASKTSTTGIWTEKNTNDKVLTFASKLMGEHNPTTGALYTAKEANVEANNIVNLQVNPAKSKAKDPYEKYYNALGENRKQAKEGGKTQITESTKKAVVTPKKAVNPPPKPTKTGGTDKYRAKVLTMINPNKTTDDEYDIWVEADQTTPIATIKKWDRERKEMKEGARKYK